MNRLDQSEPNIVGSGPMKVENTERERERWRSYLTQADRFEERKGLESSESSLALGNGGGGAGD